MPAKGAQVGTTSRKTVPGTAAEDVIVVGGGVTGTAIAWRAAAAGRGVLLIDPGGDDPRAADMATMVAAGMLAPVSESVFGEQHLLTLNLHAAERFESFNQELEAAAGLSTGLRAEGTLAVAYDHGDLTALDRLTTFRRSLGLDAERLDARECRRLEPFLAPSTRGGVLTRGDHSVDNRRYLTALRVAAARAGVRIVAGRVTRVADGEVRVALAGQPDGARLTARHVIVATGQATRSLDGLPGPVRRAVRPVKGQILRLRHPAGIPPVLRHSVRAVVQGRDLYLVPRQDGELVVGATQEEREDRDVTAGAVHELLRDAVTVVPAVSELILAEASAGLRPGTSDNGPILGLAGQDGLIIATGHFRNGILLSAVTADAVTALLGGHPPDAAWAPFTPARFS
jgi:glycine oxidase